jgi:hypothetical protein
VPSCTIPPLRIVAVTPRDAPPGDARQRWFDNQGRLIALGGRHDRSWWMHWPGLATFWFDDGGDVRAEPERPFLDAELRDIFTRGVAPVVLLARGYEGLHASAVQGPRGVVAFVGTSGTGKSTTAVAVASTGLPHFADDTMVYQLVAGTPIGVKLPFPVRVEPVVRTSLGAAAVPTSTLSSAPIRRIYDLVRDDAVDPANPAFVRVNPANRFERLLAHAHPFDMGGEDRRRAFIEHLLAIAGGLELWECRFAPDLARLRSLAAAIREHIEGPNL